MKRSLFTLTALVASAISFAQPLAQVEQNSLQKVKATDFKVVSAKPVFQAGRFVNKPNKSAETGNYFTRPAGSMYYSMDKDGMSYTKMTILSIPGLQYGVFKNMNADPASATWQLNGTDASTINIGWPLVTENNDYVWLGNPATSDELSDNMFASPTLVKGNDTYFIANPSDDASASAIYTPNDIAPLTFTETGTMYYGYQSDYGFGPGSTQFYADESQTTILTATNYGVSQHFEKPMSPLQVQDVYLMAITNSADAPLAEGVMLTMKVIGDDGTEIATMTADAESFKLLRKHTYQGWWAGGSIYIVTFAQQIDYPGLGKVTVPFVIDQPFTVEITGMEQEGVKFGFYLYESVPEDQMETGYTLARDDQGNEYNLYNTASINSLPVYFSALFDQVNVLSTISYYADENQTTTIDVENCNVLRISDDGASCWMDNEVQEPGVYVETATPWTKNGMMNYSYEVAQSSTGADNSWITACNADESGWTTYYQNMLSFTATECPAGEGRWAVLNIVGRGVTSETPIILLQGTATLDDVYAGTGIENAVVDNSADKGFDENAPVYNLNGQRVSKSAKGILIQDGRKFIRK